jgi:hypothetical protein
MTRLDMLFLISTLLVFFSLIEVLITTILENNQQKARAKKVNRYCLGFSVSGHRFQLSRCHFSVLQPIGPWSHAIQPAMEFMTL